MGGSGPQNEIVAAKGEKSTWHCVSRAEIVARLILEVPRFGVWNVTLESNSETDMFGGRVAALLFMNADLARSDSFSKTAFAISSNNQLRRAPSNTQQHSTCIPAQLNLTYAICILMPRAPAVRGESSRQ